MVLMGFDCIILVIKHVMLVIQHVLTHMFWSDYTCSDLLQGGSLWENLTNSGDVEKIFSKILSLVKTAQGMFKVSKKIREFFKDQGTK